MSDSLDTVAYYHIAYREHRIMNPLSVDRFRAVTRRYVPQSDVRLFDAGCGKGWASLIMAQEASAFCFMADTSPIWIAEARRLFSEHGLGTQAEIREEDGRVACARRDQIDVALCLGTAPLFGSFDTALDSLLLCLKPGGLIFVGEPSIDKRTPAVFQRYLNDSGWDVPPSHTYLDCAAERDLELLHVQRATIEEWDEYMGLQWKALSDHARVNPTDEIAQEYLDWMRDEQEMYLRYQRHFMDWNLFVLRIG